MTISLNARAEGKSISPFNDVRIEVNAVSDYLSQDSGYVFCANHNLLSEVDPEKVIEMYKMVHNKTIIK